MPYSVSRRAAHPGRPKGPLSVGLIWALLPFERRGTTTADLVRGNRPGTFNGTPAWSNGPRGPVISFGATTDYLSAGTAEFLPTTANFSTVLSWRKTDGTKRNSNPFGELAGVIAQRCQVHLPYSDGTVYFDYGGSTNGVTRVQAASLTFGDDIWVFTVGRRGMEIWQNGYLRASNTAQPTRTASSAGWNINKASSPGDLATTSGVLVYDRQLTPNEIATLTADISAPFRPARRRVAAKRAATGTKTGTGTATTAAATSSGAARVVHKPTGTPNATAPAATSSGAGLLEHSGAGSATAPASTSSGAGRLVHPATGTATAPAATTDGDGRVVHGATGAGAAGAVSASGTGRLVHGASGTATAGACASSGAASVVGTQTGTGSATCGAVSSDGAGRVVHRSTGSATSPSATCSGIVAGGTDNEDAGPIRVGASTRGGKPRPYHPPKYRVFDTYSSKPTVQQSAQAVEQEQARVRKVANRRAAILSAVMAASEDDYGL